MLFYPKKYQLFEFALDKMIGFTPVLISHDNIGVRIMKVVFKLSFFFFSLHRLIWHSFILLPYLVSINRCAEFPLLVGW